MRHSARQIANAANVGGTLRDADGTAGIEQIESVRRFEHLLISWQCELLTNQMLGLFFIGRKRREHERRIGVFKVVSRLLDFVLVVHIAVAERVGPLQVVDVVDTLQVHGQALKAVGNFARNGFAINAAHLLEVSELRDFHAIEPNFPAQAPCTQCWIFPIVFHKTNVVLFEVKAQSFERAQIQIQNVGRCRLEHHLVLVVVLQAIGILAITAVFRTAAGLHIGGLPWLWANGA